jgi:hypothetical protein
MSADKAYSYVYYYAEMIPHKAEGSRGLAISALTNPVYALLIAFKEEKLLFFLHLMLPLLALPLAAGRKLILCVYGLLFIGLASRSHVFSLHFQYSALLFPMLFAAVPDGLRRVTDGPRIKALGIERAPLAWTLLFGMLTASLVTTVKYGVIFPNASFKAGWNRLVRVPTTEMRERHAWVKEIAETIEPDAAVSMTSAVGPHLSNRRKAYHWPTVNDADYLVLTVDGFKKEDERRLKRIRDKKQFRLIKEDHGIAFYKRVDEEEAAEMRSAEAAEKAAERAKRKGGAVDPAAVGTIAGDTAGNAIGTASAVPVPDSTAPVTSLTAGAPSTMSTATRRDPTGAAPTGTTTGSAPTGTTTGTGAAPTTRPVKPASKPAAKPAKDGGSGAPSP